VHIITTVADMSLSAGTERMQKDICRELSNRGHKISVIYNKYGWMVDEWKKGEFNIELLRLNPRSLYKISSVGSPPSEGKLLYIHHSGHWSNLVFGVAGKYLGHMPLIIHSHLPYGNNYILPRRSLNYGSRVIDALICCSNANLDNWRKAGLTSCNAYSICNGIDTKQHIPCNNVERLSARRRLGVSPDKMVVLMLGRLVKEKGVCVLLEAWKNIVNKNNNSLVELLLVGDTLDTAILDTIENTDGAIFKHWLNDPSDAYKAADVVVVPSIWQEPFSITLLEAMAYGKPVIASDVGGIPEALGEWAKKYQEFVVPPGNANVLADVLWKLANMSQVERARIGSDAREFVTKCRSLVGTVDAIEEVLCDVENITYEKDSAARSSFCPARGMHPIVQAEQPK